ncbi:hypothetical protein C8Q75DRAFT_887065 [Abortiporus biennis]|nr:hypothetical protein C8Q75DRAFT_887065 [Abortiporus biennis]
MESESPPELPDCEWTKADLSQLKIQIVDVDTETFFGTNNLPQSSNIDEDIVDNPRRPEGPDISVQSKRFFAYLEEALIPPDQYPYESCTVDLFSFLLSDVFGYELPDGALHTTHVYIPFVAGGDRVFAKPYLRIVKGPKYCRQHCLVLEAQERSTLSDDPEPRLLADGIASFYEDRRRLEKSGEQPMTESKIVPGIIIHGTAPIFYKIPVTKELLDAAENGEVPVHETLVQRYTPVVPDPQHYLDAGMVPLTNRRAILTCLEAFKRFVVEKAL